MFYIILYFTPVTANKKLITFGPCEARFRYMYACHRNIFALFSVNSIGGYELLKCLFLYKSIGNE